VRGARVQLSRRDARELAVAAQGLRRLRPRGKVTRRHLADAVETVGTVQLDAINIVARTQFLVLFSRLGAYDVGLLHALTHPPGALFEYWGHAASLLPMAEQPWFRWRMAQSGPRGDSPVYAARRNAFAKEHAAYIAAVLAEVHERGPLTAAQLSDPRRRNGEWWERRSYGRLALEHLFARGELSGWRNGRFDRVYDVPERVIPRAVLDAPTPTLDDAHRHLALRAARSLGVATVPDLAEYYGLKNSVVKARVAELVEAGLLVEATVEGWNEATFMVSDARAGRAGRDHATLLSPFDSLIWNRSRTSRLFDFDYRIEVYVPEPRRVYGYFVMPLLLGDALVARFDLKADRRASALSVRGSYLEPGADAAVVAEAAATELHGLRAWLGLENIVVSTNGNLARPLRRVVRSQRI
jgi:uncharacterized protein YcaQ